MPHAKNFIEALELGTAINIDDQFIRYFDLDFDDCEEDDDEVLLNCDAIDSDYNLYEYRFTKAECEAARYNIDTKEWTVGYNDNKVAIYTLNKVEQS